jgi:hypothetical protein
MQGWLETERDIDRAEAVAIDGEAVAAEVPTVFNRGHLSELRGFICCLKGEFARGAEFLADTMTLFEEIQLACTAHVLETAAAWAAMTSRFELGAELLGSADRIREETGDKPRPWERAVHDRWLPALRQSLDRAVFEAAHRRGAQRGMLAALDFARRALRPTHSQDGKPGGR